MVINTGLDITDQRRSEEELRISTDRLRGILEYATSAIAVKDLDGRYLVVSRAWKDGAGVEHALGRTDGELFDGGRGRGAAAGRRGGAAHRCGGGTRAGVRRRDVPRRRLPVARRPRRGLRDRIGRDGHLRAPAGPRRRGRVVTGQVGVPGEHEPRDPDADERRDRDDATCCSRHELDARAARVRADDPAARARRCWRSSTTCSTSRRSRPAGSSSRSSTSTCAQVGRGGRRTGRSRRPTRKGARAHRPRIAATLPTACAATPAACARC